MSEVTCPAAVATPRSPSWDVGIGGCDTHAHVVGPSDRFPFDAQRHYTPPDQGVASYLGILDRLGTRIGVLVQPSVSGVDNRALLHALGAAPDRLRGVVNIVAGSLGDAEIARWTALGVRGVRVWWEGERSVGLLDDLARFLGGTGWHLDVFCREREALPSLIRRLETVSLPVIIEAMGSPRGSDRPSDPCFATLLGALRDRLVFCKLSHPYKIDGKGPPYAAAAPFARMLVEVAPDRVVWGSDWPHPMAPGPMPDDGELLDLLPRWTGDERIARAVLTANPSRFYTVTDDERDGSPSTR